MISATYLNKDKRWDAIHIAPQHIMLVEEVDEKQHPHKARSQVTLDDTNALTLQEPMIDIVHQMKGIPRLWTEAVTNKGEYMAAIVLSYISFIAPLGPDDEDAKAHTAIVLLHGLPIVTKNTFAEILAVLNAPEGPVVDFPLP